MPTITGRGEANAATLSRRERPNDGRLPVSVTIKNVSEADIEDVTALIATADGGPLAHRSIAKRITAQPRQDEQRQIEFIGSWPDDAVLHRQAQRRRVSLRTPSRGAEVGGDFPSSP